MAYTPPQLPFEVSREGAQEVLNLGRFEQRVVDDVGDFIVNPSNGPILTPGEQELVIEDPTAYFNSFYIVADPRATVAALTQGEVTHKEVIRRQQASRGITRQRKSEMFAENVKSATYASDTCRALYRFMITGELEPVEIGDNPRVVKNRVGDYVVDLLNGARIMGVTRSSSLPRTIDKMTDRFVDEPAATRDLTVLAGSNLMKKIGLWLDQLFIVSHDLARLSKSAREDLYAYAEARPDAFKKKFDLQAQLEERKAA